MTMNSRTMGTFGAVALLVLAGCEADTDGATNDAGFGHGSPRPECQQVVDPDRVAYYEVPVVVADDWGPPARVSLPVRDACPNDAIEISRDGKTLYFFWSPVVNGSNEELLAAETGTYRAEQIGSSPGTFREPTYFELQVGVEDGSVDGAPSFSPDGSFVVFHSTRADNLGYLANPPMDDYLDLYVADVVDGVPGPALNLGEPVNSVYLDGEHTLSPDGLGLYLASTRPGGLGGTDIWVSERTGRGWSEGAWSDPVNLGAPINGPGEELQPAFAADDPDTMYFASDRDGAMSIYRSTWDGAAWGTPEMVITGYVGEPALVADGSVLYFVHVLVDDDGVYGSNIWYVERTG
ncbi:MAG: PD40 domain-containing protein [Demequinaceae bacterium]|nr:PD40 domain-containing protein [Demequinaceae bacterium]